METHLILSQEVDIAREGEVNLLLAEAGELAKMIRSLIRNLHRRKTS